MPESGSGWIWIFGAIVFLLCSNAVYALVELAIGGPQATINILSLIGETYDVSVTTYVVTSMLAAATFFGVLCSLFIRKLTVETAAAKISDTIESKLQHNQGQLEKVVTKRFANLSMNDFKITEHLKHIKIQLEENQGRIEKTDKARNKYNRTIEKQIITLKEMKRKIEKIESQLTPKPHLTSRSNIQEISGVGDKIADELKTAGITTVEKLIIEEPAVIAQRTKLSDSKIEKIQGTAQLLMIPRINENKAKLLQKAGITSANKLASQNPIPLFKKIANVTKNSDDTPTLEEITSYIKSARSNFTAFN